MALIRGSPCESRYIDEELEEGNPNIRFSERQGGGCKWAQKVKPENQQKSLLGEDLDDQMARRLPGSKF